MNDNNTSSESILDKLQKESEEARGRLRNRTIEKGYFDTDSDVKKILEYEERSHFDKQWDSLSSDDKRAWLKGDKKTKRNIIEEYDSSKANIRYKNDGLGHASGTDDFANSRKSKQNRRQSNNGKREVRKRNYQNKSNGPKLTVEKRIAEEVLEATKGKIPKSELKKGNLRYRGQIKEKRLGPKAEQYLNIRKLGLNELTSMEKVVQPISHSLKKIEKMNVSTKLGAIAGIGVGLASIKSLVTKEDESKEKFFSDTIKASALTTAGIGAISLTKPLYKDLDKRLLKEKSAVAVLSRYSPASNRKMTSVLDDSARRASAKRITNIASVSANVAKVSAGLALASGLMGIKDNIAEKREVRLDSRRKIHEKKKEMKEQEKYKRKDREYGVSNFGDLAIDMFNDRLGHHKMGNSKF